jgi:hypothetical protein
MKIYNLATLDDVTWEHFRIEIPPLSFSGSFRFSFIFRRTSPEHRETFHLSEKMILVKPFVLSCRVARWHIFKPKIQIWVNLGGSCDGNFWYIFCVHLIYFMSIWYISCPFGILHVHLVYFVAFWYILCPFGIFYVHLVYFMSIWYILWPFGIFYVHLVYFMAIWYILCPFGIFYGHLVYFMSIWYILCPFGIFHVHLVYFMSIWYILWPFGIFYGHLVYFMPVCMLFGIIVPDLVYCSKKNLATLLSWRSGQHIRLRNRSCATESRQGIRIFG